MPVDRESVQELYEQYKVGIFRYVLSITRDRYMAEDVLQDVFVKLLSGKSCVAPEKAQAWLYRVARNHCFDRLRKAKREESLGERPLEAREPFQYIDLISALSPEDQEIVTLKIAGGLTHKEIASVLGITAKAAQKRYERAIAKLRDKEDKNGTEIT